ncbi:hypothetical protein EDB84DRAFT_1530494, partial [Lactarius hengduanensis]
APTPAVTILCSTSMDAQATTATTWSRRHGRQRAGLRPSLSQGLSRWVFFFFSSFVSFLIVIDSPHLPPRLGPPDYPHTPYPSGLATHCLCPATRKPVAAASVLRSAPPLPTSLRRHGGTQDPPRSTTPARRVQVSSRALPTVLPPWTPRAYVSIYLGYNMLTLLQVYTAARASHHHHCHGASVAPCAERQRNRGRRRRGDIGDRHNIDGDDDNGRQRGRWRR